MCKLTIVIPIYNSQDTILRCLNSIPKREDIELICCDDCSTDSSWDILNKWVNDNIGYFNNIIIYRNEENLGVGKTKKSMYERASGEYIITIDSDDYVYTAEYSRAIDRLYEEHADNELLVLDFCGNDNIRNRLFQFAVATWRYFVRLKYLKENNLSIYEYRRAEDWYMLEDAKKLDTLKQPRKIPLNILAYHYNHPRVNSISYNWNKNKKV